LYVSKSRMWLLCEDLSLHRTNVKYHEFVVPG
jgi:hypothetical protein